MGRRVKVVKPFFSAVLVPFSLLMNVVSSESFPFVAFSCCEAFATVPVPNDPPNLVRGSDLVHDADKEEDEDGAGDGVEEALVLFELRFLTRGKPRTERRSLTIIRT